jgi:putative flippase GtrA
MNRWMTFSAVGLLGLALQLAVLTLLIRVADVHYLAATALSVEVTVLHNFVWHQRWTWGDRPSLSTRVTAARLARFHLLNGAVSMAGNLALVRLLTGSAAIDPVVANLMAVVACSSINFCGSHAIVFAAQPRVVAGALAATFSIAPLEAAANSQSSPLEPSTLAAWQAYEREVDDRYARTGGDPFFAHDAFAGDRRWRTEAELAAGGGQVPVLQLPAARPGGPPPNVPGGRIHHWVGAVFVPRTTVDAVVSSLLAHAGGEAGKYEDVIASRLIARDGDRVRVFMKLRRTKVITATYDTEHSVEYRRLSAQRASSRSVATRIAELAEAGTAGEREKTPEEDSGYLWRLNAYWRYEQTPGGVLIECESVSLSRNIPALLRPFISGMVEGVARESLEKTLLGLRRVLTRA